MLLTAKIVNSSLHNQSVASVEVCFLVLYLLEKAIHLKKFSVYKVELSICNIMDSVSHCKSSWDELLLCFIIKLQLKLKCS